MEARKEGEPGNEAKKTQISVYVLFELKMFIWLLLHLSHEICGTVHVVQKICCPIIQSVDI